MTCLFLDLKVRWDLGAVLRIIGGGMPKWAWLNRFSKEEYRIPFNFSNFVKNDHFLLIFCCFS